MMKLSYLFGLLLLVSLSPSLMAAEDAFDALDSALESQFDDLDAQLEKQYQALDEAIKQAHQRLETEVEATWGKDEVQLQTTNMWVDYSEDKRLRRKIDFNSGMVEIERIISDGESMESVVESIENASQAIATDNLQQLARKDTVLAYARQTMAEQNIPLEEFVQTDQKPVLGSLLGTLPKGEELALLVDGAATEGPSKVGNTTATVSQMSNQKKKITVQTPLRLGFESTLAGRYRTSVIRESKRQSLPASLVYAVMETESNFNPRARSAVPAFGLMQLVPRSGAMDAYRHVYGEKTLLDPEYLYNVEQNVELGAAYLNLLYTRYLRSITDPQSRQYCTIAAYNTGAGNVARSFNGTTNVKKASRVINELTPKQVYQHMVENLPYEETRNYIQKVTKAQKKYVSMDQYALTQGM